MEMLSPVKLATLHWMSAMALSPALSAAPVAIAKSRTCAGACSRSNSELVRERYPQPAAYRRFALDSDGDVARGRAAFNDARAACFRCHTVDGTRGKAGPDLMAIGDKYPRHGLIQPVLEPSSSILPVTAPRL